MKSIVLIFSMLMCFALGADAQTKVAASDSTSKYPVVAKLKDNSIVKGMLVEETDKNVSIQTVAGKLVISRENIVSLDRTFIRFVKLTLNDGSVYMGGVVSENSNEIVLYSASTGEIHVPVGTIQKKEYINDEQASDKSFANPHSTRYLFGPSAIPIEKNEGYYQNIYFLYNAAHFGISENISVGGGMVFPIAAFIAPKVGYEVAPNFHLGAGVLAGAIVIDMTTFGVAYGLATYGNREHNITLGGGYMYLSNDWGESPIITASAMSRLGRNVSIVTENWFFRDDDDYMNQIYSLAFRVLGRHHSIDFGVVTFVGDVSHGGTFFGLPYLDYVYKFNRK